MGKRTLFCLAFVGALLFSGAAAAQVTPSDVRDLIGARAAGAESELASRGYVGAGGRTGDDRKWTYWWNERRGVCLSVATVNGRYDSIVSTSAADCRQGASNGYPGADSARRMDGPRDHIALVCYGSEEKLETESRDGYEWDGDKRRYVQRQGYDLTTKDRDTSVSIEIDGDRGRIKPAKDMVPLMHGDSDNGWFDIANLSVSSDTIRGDFKLNGLNRPKLTIDRRSGRITLEGLTNFRGTCDSTAAAPRF